MTVESRAELRKEINNAIAVLDTIDYAAEQLMADPDAEADEAIHVLLTRPLERTDDLLLAMSAHRLTTSATARVDAMRCPAGGPTKEHRQGTRTTTNTTAPKPETAETDVMR